MKKTLMTLLPFVALLTLSAEAKVLPIQSYNILTQQFSMLNTCRAEGYIVDTAVLKRLDKLIKRFEYQDASGTTTRITPAMEQEYHNRADMDIMNARMLGQQDQASIACNKVLKDFTDRFDELEAKISATNPSQTESPALAPAPTAPEDRPMTWDNSPVQGIQVH
ncbi:hypothetical protein MWR31_15890 [Enterobacter hormaechei]|uniref:hypothetical protein n=1 Tax=Enterobacteriaceae TaxID=543 RepID=UPI000DA310EC|nr:MULTISPECIES: hypothetical protein [Enterobacteriaceae]ELY2914032.1 hypothetical protein [Cronobacter sakazakii]EFI5421408.1 hypothetical protein [Escherichia coli]EJP6321578.1 hypothetical protein [Escherichia coli]EKP8360919.1 hypothetical protein [Escherichia coli]ELH6340636.1 hypothetical protein [Escherichia coli]